MSIAHRLPRLRSKVKVKLLTDTCTINRVTRVSNGAGGWEESSAAVATVPCRISPVISLGNEREAQIAQSLDGTASHRVLMPAGTDVRQDDTITSHGAIFMVTGVRLWYTDEIVREVFVTEDVD